MLHDSHTLLCNIILITIRFSKRREPDVGKKSWAKAGLLLGVIVAIPVASAREREKRLDGATPASINDVYIVDKASVRKARASLFGLRLPSLGLFSEDTSDTNTVTQLDGVIAAAVQEGYGNWRVTLQDGSTWVQTDEVALGMSPKPGNKVMIKRGLMASYKMNINGRSAIRVKRLS
jgi:hypothetical protein